MAVSDPEAPLDELARVTRPAARSPLVDHLGAEAGPRRLCEQGVVPIARHCIVVVS